MKALGLTPAVLSRLDIDAALDLALDQPPELLPPQTIDQVVDDKRARAARRIGSAIRSTYRLRAAEHLFAPKAGLGLRPVAVLSIVERALLEGLVAAIEPALTSPARSAEDYRRFSDEPATAVQRAGYVVMADIDAFYDYIDHQILLYEIVNQTGDLTIADALVDVLTTLMNRRFGLPQGYAASDVLSELVADMVERRLLRAGLPVWRYSDDFRIVTTTWRDAMHAIEVLTIELRRLGLHPNDGKAYALRARTYRKWIAEPEKKWQELVSEADFNIDDLFTPYGTDEIEDVTATPGISGAAITALELWQATTRSISTERRDGLQATNLRRLTRRALTILQLFRNAGGLEYCLELWSREPELTSRIGRYLSSIAETDAAEVNSTIEAIVKSTKASVEGWRGLHLLEAAIATDHTTTDIVDWATRLMQNSNAGAVAARAAAFLSRHEQIKAEEVLELVDSVPFASQPDVGLALGYRAASLNPSTLEAARKESIWLRWSIDSVGDA